MKKLMLGMGVVLLAGCVSHSNYVGDVDTGYDALVKNDLKNAERHFKAALAKNPNDAYAMLDLGVVYQKTGRTAEARTLYTKVANMTGKEVPARTTSPVKNQNKNLNQIARENLASLKAKR